MKNMLRLSVMLVAWLLLFISCKQSQSPAYNDDKSVTATTNKYELALKSGLKDGSYPRQFNNLFSNAVNGISYYTGEVGRPKWYSKAGLYGRYVLRMYIGVRLNNARTAIVSMDAPIFDLYEITDIKFNPGGSASIQCNRVGQFNADSWQRLNQSNGDFRTLGITLKTNSPVSNFSNAWSKF